MEIAKITYKRYICWLTLLIATSLAFSPAIFAQDVAPLERLVASGNINNDRSSILILDLSDGNELVSLNPERPLLPASIMKSVTTATLLSACGIDFKYETMIQTDGEIEDGTLKGNLIVVGSGDPSVNTRAKDLQTSDIIAEICDELSNLGITKIEGKIMVEEGQFTGPSVPESWQKGDLSQAYGTGSHGFNFESNASGSSSVSNPAAIFITRLQRALEAKGISLGRADTGSNQRSNLLIHTSPTIDDIMRSCMMRSDNLFAESLLRTYAVVNDLEGTTKEAAAMEYDFWRNLGLPMEGVTIIDGSGLSRQNRLTAEFLAEVLKRMSDNPYYASFFPLAGQEGTLKKFLAGTPLEGYVAMKTGSMKGVQCYAGYKLDDNYAPTHVIVVMMNDFASRDRAKNGIANLLLETFGNS